MMPEISVIVPVYNAEKFLARCLNSILKQSYKNFELLLIDDGSTDHSSQICDDFGKTDSRIIVHHVENNGAAAARNHGIECAKGNYIAFADADDYMDIGYLDTLYRISCEYNCDIVQCKYIITSSDSIEFSKSNNDPYIETGREAINRFFDSRIQDVYVFWNKIYKRSIWKNIRIPEGKICEDQAVLHELFYAASKVAFIDDELYAYYMTPQSVTRGKFSVKQLDIIDAYERRLMFVIDNNLNEYTVKCYWSLCTVILEQYANCKINHVDNNVLKSLQLKFKKVSRSLLKEKKGLSRGMIISLVIGQLSLSVANKIISK